jgi:hypothetical protein
MMTSRLLAVLRNAAVAMLLVAASGAGASEAIGLLSDTGYTKCDDGAQNAAACDESTSGDDAPAPRQDGRFGRDAAAAMGRITKIGGGDSAFDFTRICMNGDSEGTGSCPRSPPMPTDVENPKPTDWACVRDNLTGLTWSLGNRVRATWDEASSTADGSYIQHADATARCGLNSGWRLPARREGFQFVDLNRELPSVDPAYFPIVGIYQGNDASISYWTTDPEPNHPALNWVYQFTWADLATGQCRRSVNEYPCDGAPADYRWTSGVLLVNGEWQKAQTNGQSGERWQIRDDGLVVTDSATALVWDRCTWGQEGTACHGDGAVFPNWIDAMQVARIANEQHYRGYDDWRVPNERELESLVKLDAEPPAPTIDAGTFPNTSSTFYWASSSYGSLETMSNWGYTVDFLDGLVTAILKQVDPHQYPTRCKIRLVRGGQPWAAFDGVNDRLFHSDFDSPPKSIATLH